MEIDYYSLNYVIQMIPKRSLKIWYHVESVTKPFRGGGENIQLFESYQTQNVNTINYHELYCK